MAAVASPPAMPPQASFLYTAAAPAVPVPYVWGSWAVAAHGVRTRQQLSGSAAVPAALRVVLPRRRRAARRLAIGVVPAAIPAGHARRCGAGERGRQPDRRRDDREGHRRRPVLADAHCRRPSSELVAAAAAPDLPRPRRARRRRVVRPPPTIFACGEEPTRKRR
ncbi:hypothetical protein ACP70R_047859 [Stipagrostis hirtigluma subsp. patula]